MFDYKDLSTLETNLVTVKDQLARHIDRRTFAQITANEKKREVKNKRELTRRIADIRTTFAASIGPMPYNSSTPLNARVTGTIVEETLTVEKVVFTSRPHIYVTATVYVPHGLELPAPAVLFQPGHAENGKAYPQYQQVARTIAAHGLIVMLMDPPGQGERLNYWEKGEAKPRIPGAVDDHDRFGSLFHLAGRTASGYFLSDAMRAIDYLISRPDVDPSRIGATGSSGGGTMTSVLAVLDPRVAAAAPGTFLTTRDAITVVAQGQDIEQMWPGTLINGYDHHEMITAFCPKPYLILAVDSDFFPIDGTYEIYDYAKECYRIAGKPDNLRIVQDASLHKYTLPLAKAAGRFFAEVFGLPERDVSIEKVPVLRDEELFATASGQVVWEYPDAWPMWREAQEYLKHVYRPGKEVRERGLKRLLNVYSAPAGALGFRTTASYDGGKRKNVVWLSGKNLPCYGVLLTEKPGERQPVTVAVLPHGLWDAEKYADDIEAILAKGRTVLLANLTGRGAARPHKLLPHDGWLRSYFKADSDLMFLGDSYCTLLARDIVGTCRVVAHELGDETPEIFAPREAAIWARFAAVELPGVTVTSKDEVTLASLFEDPYYDHDLVYSIRALGLAQYLK